MPKKKSTRKPSICPRCGFDAGEPVRTWQLVSPLPDKKGRITVTIMGAFECPSCGYKWKAVLQKMKVGGEEETPSEEAPPREGEIIEIDLDDL